MIYNGAFNVHGHELHSDRKEVQPRTQGASESKSLGTRLEEVRHLVIVSNLCYSSKNVVGDICNVQ